MKSGHPLSRHHLCLEVDVGSRSQRNLETPRSTDVLDDGPHLQKRRGCDSFQLRRWLDLDVASWSAVLDLVEHLADVVAGHLSCSCVLASDQLASKSVVSVAADQDSVGLGGKECLDVADAGS